MNSLCTVSDWVVNSLCTVSDWVVNSQCTVSDWVVNSLCTITFPGRLLHALTIFASYDDNYAPLCIIISHAAMQRLRSAFVLSSTHDYCHAALQAPIIFAQLAHHLRPSWPPSSPIIFCSAFFTPKCTNSKLCLIKLIHRAVSSQRF